MANILYAIDRKALGWHGIRHTEKSHYIAYHIAKGCVKTLCNMTLMTSLITPTMSNPACEICDTRLIELLSIIPKD
jgi:hypothetical protein